MAISERVRVPMPGGVIVRRTGTPYAYKVTETYRDGAGRPTNRRVQIGRMDPGTGMLFPNDRYWELCAAEAPAPAAEELPSDGSVVSVGASWAVSELLRRDGMAAALSSALGAADGEAALAAATYMLCRGNVMAGCSDWSDGFAPGLPRLTSQSASALFARLAGRERRVALLRAWGEGIPEDEWLAYDVTSVSTYSENVSGAEWGHNRDGDALPQVNLAMYVGQRSRLPWAYRPYAGSVNDVSDLPHMMADNADLGIGGGVTFVMDRGFCSTRNMRWMRDNGVAFLAGVELRHKAARSAAASALAGVHRSENRLPGGVWGASVPGTYYGVRATLHVLFDPALQARNDRDLERAVANDELAAASLRDPTRAQLRRLSRYLDLEVGGDGRVSSSRAHGRIDDAMALHGCFCLLASDPSLDAAGALAAYRQRECVEKGYYDLKNHVDMDRLRTHSDATTDGKMMCAFAATVASFELERRIGPLMRERSMSKRDVVRELEKVRVVLAPGGRRLYTHVTKRQREILEGLGLSADELVAFIASL